MPPRRNTPTLSTAIAGKWNATTTLSLCISKAASFVGKEFMIADIRVGVGSTAGGTCFQARAIRLRLFRISNSWFRAIDSQPAVAKARAVSKSRAFKKEMDEETKRALFPSNFPKSAV